MKERVEQDYRLGLGTLASWGGVWCPGPGVRAGAGGTAWPRGPASKQDRAIGSLSWGVWLPIGVHTCGEESGPQMHHRGRGGACALHIFSPTEGHGAAA